MSDELNKEILKIKRQSEKNASKNLKPVLEAYKRSLDRVQDEIGRIALQHSEDGKLKVSQVQRYNILKDLENQLVEQANELGNLDLKTTTSILEDTYENTYYNTAYQLDKGMEINSSFAIVRPEIVQAAVFTPIEGEMFSDRIWKNKDKLVRRVRSAVERSMINGEDPAKLAREIKNEFGSSAYQATRLTQTETARVSRSASDDIFRESGVVKEVMFDATLDDKISEQCESNDGKTFPIDNKPEIPLHPNCRSEYVPAVKGWSPQKKRENIKNAEGDKPLIDYSSVSKWKESRGIS